MILLAGVLGVIAAIELADRWTARRVAKWERRARVARMTAVQIDAQSVILDAAIDIMESRPDPATRARLEAIVYGPAIDDDDPFGEAEL